MEKGKELINLIDEHEGEFSPDFFEKPEGVVSDTQGNLSIESLTQLNEGKHGIVIDEAYAARYQEESLIKSQQIDLEQKNVEVAKTVSQESIISRWSDLISLAKKNGNFIPEMTSSVPKTEEELAEFIEKFSNYTPEAEEELNEVSPEEVKAESTDDDIPEMYSEPEHPLVPVAGTIPNTSNESNYIPQTTAPLPVAAELSENELQEMITDATSDVPEMMRDEDAIDKDSLETFIKLIKSSKKLTYGNNTLSYLQVNGSEQAIRTNVESTIGISDDEFISTIKKVKINSKRRGRVPLPNSQMIAEIVGAGSDNFISVFSEGQNDENPWKYELAKYKAVADNIVATVPPMTGKEITRRIHYRDFDMLALGFIMGSMDEVKFPHSCDNDKCSSSEIMLILEAKPQDLLLNKEEIKASYDDIMTNANNQTAGLSNIRHVIVDEELPISITLKDPSYKEYIEFLMAIRDYNRVNASAEENRQIRLQMWANREILCRMEKCIIDDGGSKPKETSISKPYQNLTIIKELCTNTKSALTMTAYGMAKAVQDIKLGFTNVECPTCGKIQEDITLEGILAVVFYHIQVLNYSQLADSDLMQDMMKK